MDPDRTPTEPTAVDEPPTVTPVTPGISQAATTAPAGRRRRTGFSGLAVGLALVVMFGAGIGVGGAAVAAIGGGVAAPPSPVPQAGETDLGLVNEAWDTLHTEYVGRDQLDDRALIYGAIEGMTQAVGDTGHTDFMTPEERAARNESLSGSYVGIGVRIDAGEGGPPRIVDVFAGSPAEAAGLQAGDVIVKVDDQSTMDLAVDEVAARVRGEAGTTVTITVRADGTGPARTYDIVRADVPLQPVSWTLIPGSTTALIRLEQFSSGAADDMVQALKDARSQGAERIVLDLRGNPGGYVNEAVGIASQFLASGVVYIERDAQGKETPHEVSAGGAATDLPLVVLVSGDSASASEIVAGALQDAGRARIVGETTYGTGTVLGEFVLSDGSALRVGTVEWLTPSGRRIWHEGIAPDVPVAEPADADRLTPDEIRTMTPADVATLGDDQLARALSIVVEEAVASN